MEFDEHDEDHEDEEMGIPVQASYEGGLSSKMTIGEGASRKNGGCRYRECLKNHAIGLGSHAVDGCGEFLAAGDEGTLDGLKCAACNCHRNFHRKEVEGDQSFHHNQQQQPPHHHLHHHSQAAAHGQFTSSPYYRTTPPAGYLHLTHHQVAGGHHRPLALPATSGGGGEDEDMSNPSSSGGGGGGGGSGGGGGGGGSSRKRFRTKFTQEQKDKMLEFAEKLGWRIQKHDEAAVQLFCQESGVKRHVLKVWMHNNKHTLGKKP